MSAPSADAQPAPQRIATAAIVGRPNVGKSALFNRLVGRRQALVEEVAGTTRDRVYGNATWKDTSLRLVDTGGIDPAADATYSRLIRSQVEQAIDEADVLVFVVDARSGIIPADEEVAQLLRRTQKPVILVANKADNESRKNEAVQFYELGLGEPHSTSAQHGTGLVDLLERIIELVPDLQPAIVSTLPRLAIVGRPNVGKSMLLNAILQEERVIVSPVAGTTRDAIDTPCTFAGRQITLVDTAGLRRPGKIGLGLEHHATLRARHALERSDVALIVFDASEGLTAQDMHVLGLAMKASTGIVLVANKWDLVTEKTPSQFEGDVRARLRFATWAKFAVVSALERTGIDPLLHTALAVRDEREKRIDTAPLNSIIRRAVAERPLPLVRNQQANLFYATQVRAAPPTFVFFVNDASLIHFSYRRYLENVLRQHYGFDGVALRLHFRSRKTA